MANKKRPNLIALDKNNYYGSLTRADKSVFLEYVCRKMGISKQTLQRKLTGLGPVSPAESAYYQSLVDVFENVRKDRILQLS